MYQFQAYSSTYKNLGYQHIANAKKKKNAATRVTKTQFSYNFHRKLDEKKTRKQFVPVNKPIKGLNV